MMPVYGKVHGAVKQAIDLLRAGEGVIAYRKFVFFQDIGGITCHALRSSLTTVTACLCSVHHFVL